MTVETTKALYLTKEERRIISQFCNILNDDKDLDVLGAWEIFLAIRDNDNNLAGDYNYTIVITD